MYLVCKHFAYQLSAGELQVDLLPLLDVCKGTVTNGACSTDPNPKGRVSKVCFILQMIASYITPQTRVRCTYLRMVLVVMKLAMCFTPAHVNADLVKM